MKSRIKLALSTGLLTPVFVFAPVLAIEGTDTTTTTTQTTEQTTSEQKKQQMQERLEKRKAELNLKLTTFQQKRLQTRCKPAQGQLKSVSGRINGIETSRTQVHKNLIDRLTNLKTKLDAKGADTTEFQTQVTELQAKIDTFKTDLETYKTAVADLSEMDCAADPVAFKASLETARTALKQVQEDSKAIKAYVNETIKPTLKTIRATLQGGEESTTETETKPEDTTTTTPTETEAN